MKKRKENNKKLPKLPKVPKNEKCFRIKNKNSFQKIGTFRRAGFFASKATKSMSPTPVLYYYKDFLLRASGKPISNLLFH